MLINRTYRTWIYDYPQDYAGISASSHRTPSQSCPNNITGIVAGVSSPNNTFVSNSFLSLNVNNTTGDNTNYIYLYDGNTSGLSYDVSHPFYGKISNIGTSVISNGFVSLGVNGQTCYVRRYLGPANYNCSSALRCSVLAENYGTFVEYGYALINAAGSLKFIRVYILQ